MRQGKWKPRVRSIDCRAYFVMNRPSHLDYVEAMVHLQARVASSTLALARKRSQHFSSSEDLVSFPASKWKREDARPRALVIGA